jgi:uncharacterized repeat protein (TIGR03843 family)
LPQDERPPPAVYVSAPTPSKPKRPTAAELLTDGEMTVHGRIPGSSNATLLVSCELQELEMLAVYKPASGERELWDFPWGLWRREVAAFELSKELGWGLVPETVERTSAPFGAGSVQRYVEEDGQSHYFTLRDAEEWHDQLVLMAAFDVVANNADRKSGHVLLAEDRLWAIDNGLCFHPDDKLRTVIWDYVGEPLPDRVTKDLTRLVDQGLSERIGELLDEEECEAVLDRSRLLLIEGLLPEPRTDRPYPWPLV